MRQNFVRSNIYCKTFSINLSEEYPIQPLGIKSNAFLFVVCASLQEMLIAASDLVLFHHFERFSSGEEYACFDLMDMQLNIRD